ncbi:LbetaH domain-containing protein [Salinactinospora qingdaonensis]|uniref:Sugar O-acyltransferase, sialic acid O-acetyltransferase NeuD family n=1 Tax=Salinactinospora qingdaonensis TaxID=702744 RepID=A0ABP7G3E5_9ACTN
MKELVIIGAGKFALEVTRYIDDITAAGEEQYRIAGYLPVPEESTHAPADLCLAPEEFPPKAGTRVVLALSDTGHRRAMIDDLIDKHALIAENIVHPSAMVEPAALQGAGIIIGPRNYVGVNVTLGSHTVVNYHCTIGHHSRLGANNFLAPNFNCGNSITVGDDNFFGLSCTIAPEVVIGDDCRFQAGISLFDNADSGFSYLSPSRIKSIKSS